MEQFIDAIAKIIAVKIENALCVSKSIQKKNLIEEIGEHSKKCAKIINQDAVSANAKSEIEDNTDKICAENMVWPLLAIYKHAKQMIGSKYISWYGITDK